MSDLYKRLKKYSESNVYPFHMPGHKRQRELLTNELPYHLDITEITDFDNLHAPEKGGVLERLYEEMKTYYDTDMTFPLVNGSTCGIFAAITAVTSFQDEIVIARNCHKAVYRACELLGLDVHYIYPDYIKEYGIFADIWIEDMEEFLTKYPKSKAVIITSPSYEGIILDVGRISEVVHRHNMVLIVDEAHGAHLPYMEKAGKDWEKKSAISQGADIVIESMHKTLPSLTQTALLHLTKNSLVSRQRLKESVALYQTTSPSYLLMASMDECFNWCVSDQGRDTFASYALLLEKLRIRLSRLENLHLLTKEELEISGYDAGKLVLITAGTSINGKELFDRLRDEFQLECEMAAQDYVIAMTSVMDSEEGLERLAKALETIDARIEKVKEVIPRPIQHEKKPEKKRKLRLVTEEEIQENALKEKHIQENGTMIHHSKMMEEENTGFYKPQARYTLYEASHKEKAEVSIDKIKFQLKNDYVCQSALPLKNVYKSFISGGYVMVYPPGIPILVPGEEITFEVLQSVIRAKESGLKVIGMENGCIQVLV